MHKTFFFCFFFFLVQCTGHCNGLFRLNKDQFLHCTSQWTKEIFFLFWVTLTSKSQCRVLGVTKISWLGFLFFFFFPTLQTTTGSDEGVDSMTSMTPNLFIPKNPQLHTPESRQGRSTPHPFIRRYKKVPQQLLDPCKTCCQLLPLCSRSHQPGFLFPSEVDISTGYPCGTCSVNWQVPFPETMPRSIPAG